ncbi:B3 domain-containing protein, partial [Trifolium medium]|nr:B3 domain-containing protein [Trifolium medium]
GGREKRHGMSVSVLDPRVTLYHGMRLVKWRMVTSEIYNITGEWKELVAENQLKEGQKVQLWSFRSHQQLYFALVKL